MRPWSSRSLYSSVCSVSRSYLTLYDPLDYNPPGSSVQGILQARILEWVAISFSRGSSWSRDQNFMSCISCIGRRILYPQVTEEALYFSRRKAITKKGLNKARQLVISTTKTKQKPHKTKNYYRMAERQRSNILNRGAVGGKGSEGLAKAVTSERT